MIDPLAAMIVAAAALTGLVTAAGASRKRAVRTADVWKRAARLVGGQWVDPQGTWYALRAGAIRATVDDVVVTVITDATLHTHAKAEASNAASLGIWARPSELSSKTTGAFPIQMSCGDEAFDAAHFVATTHADLARAWMSPKVQRAVAASRPYDFRLAHGQVQVSREGLEHDADRLARVVKAAGVFAASGKQIARAWSMAAQRLGGEHGSPLTMAGGPSSAMRLKRGAVDISVGLEIRAEHAFTVLRAGDERVEIAGVVTKVELLDEAIDALVAKLNVAVEGPYR